jgi:hypothetical protein
MAIRLPLTTVGSFTDANDTGTGSVAGGIPHLFTLPQDTDNVVVKMTASVAGTGVSAVLQTTDDGGATYYDVARTSIVSNANNALAQWISVPVLGGGVSTGATFATGSIVSMGIGSAAASTLGQRAVSGLPILSRQGRVFIRINGDVTSAAANSIVTKVIANSQSATA